jgi:large subunit ribosomal protein L18
MADVRKLFHRRRWRVRRRLLATAAGRPRLSVFRSNRHIYAQVIDDRAGRTLASASTMDPVLRGPGAAGARRDAAQQVGTLVAERALAVGVKDVVFDRGGYRYHGRIKALADAAREAGLGF